MRIRLSAQAIGRRIETVEQALQNDGSVTRPIPPREPPDAIWYVDLHVEAPGYGLPRTAVPRSPPAHRQCPFPRRPDGHLGGTR